VRTLSTFLIYTATLLFALTATAEYRVYILKIEDSTTGQSRVVTTTLDDRQYSEYYPVRLSERVSISETWKCRHTRSDISQDVEQKYCTNPRAPASAAPSGKGLGNATFTDPKPASKP
jgi:hypothetical protein